MTTELQIHPSETLLELINSWADGYIRSVELPMKILEQGEKDGLSKQDIRKIVEGALVKRGLSDRRIREVLPSELKDITKVTHKSMRKYSAASDIEQSKNDHGNEIASDEPLYTMVKSTSGLEGTVELDPATDVMNKLQDLTRDNENLRNELHDEREVIAKLSVTTADKQDANMDQLFDMLPNDDIDTFKNKNGTTLLFERLLVNFKYQKIPKLQWWVRVIK